MPFSFDDDVNIGDPVLFYTHAGDKVAHAARVVHKGMETVDLMVDVYLGDGVGPRFMAACRHVTDPIVHDPIRLQGAMHAGDSGFFDLHPDKVRIQVLEDKINELLAEQGKPAAPKAEKKKPKVVEPDLSFRLPESELTEEQKAAKKLALMSAT